MYTLITLTIFSTLHVITLSSSLWQLISLSNLISLVHVNLLSDTRVQRFKGSISCYFIAQGCINEIQVVVPSCYTHIKTR